MYKRQPKEFTQLGLYNRYQEEVLSKGQGRLADIDSHNKAVNGLMKSANQLYSDKAVDKISIHTYLAKERIKAVSYTHLDVYKRQIYASI